MADVPLPLLLGVFLLAGAVKGVTGLGLPTVGVGLLSLAMPPAQAAALVVVPSLVTNLVQMAGPAWGALLGRLWPLLLGLCLGTWLGAGLLAGAGAGAASAALGAVLLAYAGFGLSPLRLPVVPAGAEFWAGPAAGTATGLVTAATGVFVLPAVPYLQALGLGRDALVQALGLSFTVSTLALAASLAGAGAFGVGMAFDSLLALAPALAGMWAGQRLRRLLRPEVFRRAFFGGLALLGAHLLLRGLG